MNIRKKGQVVTGWSSAGVSELELWFGLKVKQSGCAQQFAVGAS